MTREKEVEIWEKTFSNHGLVDITEKARSFYLSENGNWVMSCVISFTPAGISITGDIVPSGHGSVSCRGYGIDWFASDLYPDYLAEKFLTKKFVPEVAAEEIEEETGWVKEYLRNRYEEDEQGLRDALETLERIINDLKYGELSAEVLYNEFCELGIDASDGMPGFCYPPHEVAILSSIQKRFAALYKASKAEPKERSKWHVKNIIATCKRALSSAINIILNN